MTAANSAQDLLPAEGAAFPLSVRLLATAVVAVTAYWGVRSTAHIEPAQWLKPSGLMILAAMLMVAWCLAWMWRSRTRVDHEGIHQSWVWDKRVRWTQVTQAKLIGIPTLEWLIAPRLVVRAGSGGLMIFHSADRRVLAVFATYAATGTPMLRPPMSPAA